MHFDYIIIAVVDLEIQKEIREMLEGLGIVSEKILWFDPLNRNDL